MEKTKRLKDKVALITGASRGIGRAVAMAYAKEGATVILVARSTTELEAVDDEIKRLGGQAILVPFDLQEVGKIESLAVSVLERFGHLDILVGNAGLLGRLSPIGHIPPKVWDEVMAINVTANWHLIRAFDPLLKAAPAAAALFVTSGIAQGNFPYWGPYAASKAALNALVQTYAAETTKETVSVNLVDPGIVRTQMRAQAMPGEDPVTVPLPEDIVEVFISLALPTNQMHGEIVGIDGKIKEYMI